MSGKDLPLHCAKDGPTVCAWQFPNAPMSMATDAGSHAQRWGSSPGFLDPFHVAYNCVKRLKAATFVNVINKRRRQGSDLLVDKSQLCPGLLVYMAELEQNEQVNKDLKDHIVTGAASNLTAVVQKYTCLSHVLLFLMKYLKERGPLLRFKYNTKQYLNSIVSNPRYLLNVFKTGLCQFELEFHAAVAIGDYLNFLLFVAYAHDLFWFKEILADAWGPLLVDFVNVGPLVEGLQEWEKKERVKVVAMQMIEGIPWDSMKSIENLKITINPQFEIGDNEMVRKAPQEAKKLKQLTTRPVYQVTLLGDPKEGSGNRPANILKLLGDLDSREGKEDGAPADEAGETVAA